MTELLTMAPPPDAVATMLAIPGFGQSRMTGTWGWRAARKRSQLAAMNSSPKFG